MLEVWRRVVIGSAIAVYLLGLGCAGEVLLEHMRRDERTYEARAGSLAGAQSWWWFLVGGMGPRVSSVETEP